MANEITAVVAASSTGVYALVRNPVNRAQAWDTDADDWATYDRTDSDQQIALGSAIAIGASDEEQFADLPSGLSSSVVYEFDVYDSSNERIGQGLTRLYTDANGRTNANVTAADDGVLTAAKFGASALATQPVASVTGAVGSVTGNVGGNVTGTVGSVVGAVGSVTGNVGGSVASVASTVTANVTQISGDSTAADNLELALEEQPGIAGGLPLLNASALMDANLSTVANVAQTAPAGGFASQTLLNSVNSTANNLTSAVNGLPTLTRIEMDDNSTMLAAILVDTGMDIPDAINNIAVDPETIITAMEEAGFAKESEPGAIEEGIEELPDELSGMVSGIITDVNQERIPKSRIWRLIPTSNSGLVGESTKSILLVDAPATFAVDFTSDQYANGIVSIVADPVIATGTSGGVTFSDTGRLGAQARFRITPVTAGTYKIRVTVTYDSGSKSTGEVTLKVIE